MPREVIQAIASASDDFRQVLVLSATPRLGDTSWREPILRMIEPEAATLARIEGRSVADVLRNREEAALADLSQTDCPDRWRTGFLRSGATRRIIRNGRAEWGAYLPQRRNHEVRLQPLTSERMRHEVAAMILEGTDPAQGCRNCMDSRTSPPAQRSRGKNSPDGTCRPRWHARSACGSRTRQVA